MVDNNDAHPFTRTPVLITLIVAAVLFVGGLVGVAAFVPDANTRIAPILTITLPLFVTTSVAAYGTIRTQRIASQNNDKINAVQAQTNLISQKTDGTLTKLVQHVTGEAKIPTAEIPIVVQKASDLIEGKSGQ